MAGLLETIEWVGKTVITRARVGVAEGRESVQGGDGRGTGGWARGMLTAERSASRGEGEAMGGTRVRAFQRHSVVFVPLPARLTDAVVDREIDGGAQLQREDIE